MKKCGLMGQEVLMGESAETDLVNSGVTMSPNVALPSGVAGGALRVLCGA